jgi:UDP-2-acetamido-2,6-beta-L-arabino-hexul-4-ose reductase
MESVRLHEIDLENTPADLKKALGEAQIIFHLAGVNRPRKEEEFKTGNRDFTEEICRSLREMRRTLKIVLASSIQADLDNPYGVSKRGAEEVLRRFAEETGAECVVYRFKNLFGKWCRPNYNSVTATFCHNIAHNLPIQISDPSKELELTYIDEVVEAFIAELVRREGGFRFADPLPGTWVSLGELAEKIQSYKAMRTDLRLPDFSSPFERALYATYLSYLDGEDFGYGLDVKSDQRGSLAELIKSPTIGQIFISRTKPGVTRGDHYHHTKTEKFLVVEGEAIIRFKHVDGGEIVEHRVRGEEYRVLDIPPGYTHSIENIGDGELVTLFWASEMFDAQKPDAYFMPVKEKDKDKR